MHTICGTPAYLSPEQLDSKHIHGYTAIVDWWSLGILLYELLTGRTPFCPNNEHGNHYAIYLRILSKSVSFPLFFDSKSKALISALCHRDVGHRLCHAEMISRHPYFTVPWGEVADRRLVPPYVPKLKKFGDTHHFGKSNGDRPGPQVGIGYAFKNEMFDF